MPLVENGRTNLETFVCGGTTHQLLCNWMNSIGMYTEQAKKINFCV